MVIVVWPTANAMLPDAVPEVTSSPLTVIVASASCAVGVTVADAMELPTDAVYVVVPPTVPVFVSLAAGVNDRVLSKASDEGARVTVIA